MMNEVTLLPHPLLYSGVLLHRYNCQTWDPSKPPHQILCGLSSFLYSLDHFFYFVDFIPCDSHWLQLFPIKSTLHRIPGIVFQCIELFSLHVFPLDYFKKFPCPFFIILAVKSSLQVGYSHPIPNIISEGLHFKSFFPTIYVMPDLSLVAFCYIYWRHFNGTVVSMIVGMGHLLYNIDISKGLVLGHVLEINGLYSAYGPLC